MDTIIFIFSLMQAFIQDPYNESIKLIKYLADKLEQFEITCTHTFKSLDYFIQLILKPIDYFLIDKPLNDEQLSRAATATTIINNNNDNFNFSLLILLISCLFLLIIIIIIIYYRIKINLLQKRNDLLENNELIYMCCICRYDTSNVVLLPCNHLCVCLRCFYSLKKNENQQERQRRQQQASLDENESRSKNCCPVCRTKIESNIRIYA